MLLSSWLDSDHCQVVLDSYQNFKYLCHKCFGGPRFYFEMRKMHYIGKDMFQIWLIQLFNCYHCLPIFFKHVEWKYDCSPPLSTPNTCIIILFVLWMKRSSHNVSTQHVWMGRQRRLTENAVIWTLCLKVCDIWCVTFSRLPQEMPLHDKAAAWETLLLDSKS